MIDLKDINANLENDLLRFNEALKEATQSNVELINIVINYTSFISYTCQGLG